MQSSVSEKAGIWKLMEKLQKNEGKLGNFLKIPEFWTKKKLIFQFWIWKKIRMEIRKIKKKFRNILIEEKKLSGIFKIIFKEQKNPEFCITQK